MLRRGEGGIVTLTQPLFRSDLANAQCQNPHCTHEDHERLHLKQRCHMGAALQCAFEDDVLVVRCAVCHKIVANVAVIPDGPIAFCHGNRVSCSYGRGLIDIECKTCDRAVAALVVRDRGETPA